jgi:hypothetical protein
VLATLQMELNKVAKDYFKRRLEQFIVHPPTPPLPSSSFQENNEFPREEFSETCQRLSLMVCPF